MRIKKYTEYSLNDEPAFLLLIDSKEYISHGCIFLEDTGMNRQYLKMKHNCTNELDDLLLSDDITDMSVVTNMMGMFYGCALELDITDWDVSNVTNMSMMFHGCWQELDLSNWDVSNVTDINSMFNVFKGRLNVSNWETSNIVDMRYAFNAATVDLDLSNWDVSNVVNSRNMLNNRDGKTRISPSIKKLLYKE